MGSESKRDAAQLRAMCRDDVLFTMNAFFYVYCGDTGLVLPFITYPFQDTAILRINDACGRYDLTGSKSRKQGATYMACYVPTWRFLFFERQSFLYASYNERIVDSTDNVDSLFWKVNFALTHLPKWLTGPWGKTHLHFINHETQSTIDGTATTGTLGTGGRRLMVILDEYGKWPDAVASQAQFETQSVTNTRLTISTPRGMANAYAKNVHNPKIELLTMHWSDNPEQNVGLYRQLPDGDTEIIDHKWHDQHPGYPFRNDEEGGFYDGLRSPWYDIEVDRAPMPEIIKQELDMDFLGSDFTYFKTPVLESLEAKHGCSPNQVGALDYDLMTGAYVGFEASDDGEGLLRLWDSLDDEGHWDREDQFVIGIDTAQGTGASNSVASVGNLTRGKKVAEFATNRMRPDEFGTAVVALGLWFNNARLVPESNGPGRGLIDRIVQLGYRHLYYRTAETALSRAQSDIPGFHTGKESKNSLFSEFRRAMAEEDVIIPSRETYQEAMQYVHTKSQSIEHSGARSTVNMSDVGENHGDRVVADALMWWGMRRAEPVIEEEEVVIPASSAAGRRRVWEKQQDEEDPWTN